MDFFVDAFAKSLALVWLRTHSERAVSRLLAVVPTRNETSFP